MDDIKKTVGKNIAKLRTLYNMTQIELADKLNFSDKTISKWERGESSPELSVLIEIADLFGVSLDCLVKSEDIEKTINENNPEKLKHNHKIITYLSLVGVVWIALFAFIITTLVIKEMSFQWLYFVYACPPILIVWLVFNSIWFNPKHNFLIISGLMWSILAAVHVTFLHFKIDVSLIYSLGVLGQIIILLGSFIKGNKNK